MMSTKRNNINWFSSQHRQAQCLNIHYLKIFHNLP